jgi:hypothetical protein
LIGNEDKNDRECSPSLHMLGRDENIMDGEYSPSLRCSRRWKYSGWGDSPSRQPYQFQKSAG